MGNGVCRRSRRQLETDHHAARRVVGETKRIARVEDRAPPAAIVVEKLGASRKLEASEPLEHLRVGRVYILAAGRVDVQMRDDSRLATEQSIRHRSKPAIFWRG